MAEPSSRVEAATARYQHHVLLIEDNEDTKVLVEFAVEHYGKQRYHLQWARTLSDGLDRLSKGQTDLVLLDLGLPDASGPESFARLREIAPGVPVVVVSGDTSEETQITVIVGGVNDYLVKSQMSGPLLVEAMRSAIYANKGRKSNTIVPRDTRENSPQTS